MGTIGMIPRAKEKALDSSPILKDKIRMTLALAW